MLETPDFDTLLVLMDVAKEKECRCPGVRALAVQLLRVAEKVPSEIAIPIMHHFGGVIDAPSLLETLVPEAHTLTGRIDRVEHFSPEADEHKCQNVVFTITCPVESMNKAHALSRLTGPVLLNTSKTVRWSMHYRPSPVPMKDLREAEAVRFESLASQHYRVLHDLLVDTTVLGEMTLPPGMARSADGRGVSLTDILDSVDAGGVRQDMDDDEQE